ncbi:ATP-binding cassette domain-containing protein, partial [Peptoniphilus asaccharolyticus]
QDLKINKKQIEISSIVSVMETIIDGVLFYFTISMGVSNTIFIGDVITYIRSISNSKSNITAILLGVSNIINESLFIGQLFEYFELPEESNFGKIKMDKILKIEIIHLSYKYPNSEVYVLKDVNLKIEGNKKIALVGVNGSGKTTLIKLIMGFYNNYEGSILINGIESRNIDKKSLLNQISTLFQDFVKYEATFRENIAYSNLSIIDNDIKISDIAHKFNFLDLINKNEKKLDTQLGIWFDNGINLSAGQWQKIALARAFAKNSSMYILDEPNAAMDTITEREIAKLYGDILEDKIGIIIAHRFINIINFVDEIVVLENGRIIERGNHNELMNKKGKYYELL